jgi:16S rRNA (uracil1498-N3)-methyltransferase
MGLASSCLSPFLALRIPAAQQKFYMIPESRKNAAPAPRVHVPSPLAAGARTVLPEAAGHHLVHVLRLRPGAPVVLFDGSGGEHDAIITGVGRAGVAVDVGGWRAVQREARLAVHLAQGVSSGERMDYTLQKAVELGVAGIEPIITARSVVRLDGERAARRRAHWERVCVSACEQCGRDRVPAVQPPCAMADWLSALPARAATFPLRILLSPDAADSLRDLEPPPGPILLLAGPEGGLTPQERADARRSGFRAVRLGPRILRTETAALAALAALHALWGDF